MTTYFTQLKSSWDEYLPMISLPCCTCGNGSVYMKLLEDQQVLQFLMGLHEEFKIERENILMMQHLPKLSQVYRLILQEERQRDCNNQHPINSDSAAFASAYNRSGGNSGNSFAQKQYNKKFQFTKDSVLGETSQQGQGPVFGIAPNGKKSKYYCTHYKVFSHSVTQMRDVLRYMGIQMNRRWDIMAREWQRMFKVFSKTLILFMMIVTMMVLFRIMATPVEQSIF